MTSHKRRTGRRRALVSGLAALCITGASVVATGLLTSAGATQAGATAARAWPQARGDKPVTETIEVSGTYDGKLQRFYGTGELGSGGQQENQKPVFVLRDGAVLKNVIIGSPAADGVHCLGSCTVQNVWWENVGEDAATFKGTSASAVYAVHGGGAKGASDKVFQFNGAGKLVVTKFQVSDFGKLVRSCGNCAKQYPRTILINDVDITAPGKSIVGVNSNYGDIATLRNIRIHGDTKKKTKPCTRFTGNDTGKEPDEIGTGPDGTTCRYSVSDVRYE
ncbi:pectate lyase [Streptomyces sp. NPDC006450]|uniref:pectate lyase n=1 Tax=Streptomyces sp. NPDC006450 TaxID=3155458 RepID=UPI0033A945D3